jgi:hypothetical protein
MPPIEHEQLCSEQNKGEFTVDGQTLITNLEQPIKRIHRERSEADAELKT